MDGDEEPGDAARRECLEETGLIVETGELIDLVSGREHEQGADIVLVFQAKLTGGKIQAGDDAAKAEFFPLDSLPPLAFKATSKTLEKLRMLSNTN